MKPVSKKKGGGGTREMAQGLTVPAALEEYPSSVPSTCIRQLNSNSWGIMPSSGSCRHQAYTYTHEANIHT